MRPQEGGGAGEGGGQGLRWRRVDGELDVTRGGRARGIVKLHWFDGVISLRKDDYGGDAFHCDDGSSGMPVDCGRQNVLVDKEGGAGGKVAFRVLRRGLMMNLED